MDEQAVEHKTSFFTRLLGAKGTSSSFVQFGFLAVGLVLTIGAFVILQGFIYGVVHEEQSQVSDDFVEEIVADFFKLKRPLEDITALIALSDEPSAEQIRTVVAQRQNDFRYYTQMVWFYKTADKGWSYAYLLGSTLENEILSAGRLQVSSQLLATLLKQGALESADAQFYTDGDVFETRQHRQSPKVRSTPFGVVQAIQNGQSERGFVLAVLDVVGFYDDSWLQGHKYLSSMSIQGANGEMPFFAFERESERSQSDRDVLQIYEFPFAGETFEVSGRLRLDQRTRLLMYFPYMVGAFGLMVVVVGLLYIRDHQRQAKRLESVNETLEQKKFELKAEAKERERLKQAVRAAEKKGRAVVDAVGDIIFEADKDGRIVFINKSWEAVTGFEIDQTRGQTLTQLIHPQDQDAVLKALQSAIYDRKGDVRSFTQVRLADGTFKAVELNLKLVRQGGQDTRPRVVGTFTDIEERRKVERALSDAEKKYRSIVENAAGGIFQITAEGMYLSVNPAFSKILGYHSPEQLLRNIKNANEQLYLDKAHRVRFYERLSDSRDALSDEFEMRKRDGSVIWVRESARAVVDDGSQLLFFEGSIEDITQRKKAELEIYEAKINSDLANRAKSEFLSNMSHELRTPLNSIIGFSEMITSEVYGKIEQKEYADYALDIHDSGKRLLQVINEILDISKIEAGERQLNESVIDVRKVAYDTMDLLETKIENAQTQVTVSLDGMPDIIGEELALKQILLNLLSNAVKFTPDQGRVTVSGQVDRDGRVHISVTDTGIGLNEYEIKKALSPFGQLDSELKRSGSGTGLGLTLVDALVKLHGGEFALFSKKGIGTTATVILPADRVIQDKAADQSADEQAAQSSFEQDAVE